MDALCGNDDGVQQEIIIGCFPFILYNFSLVELAKNIFKE